MGLDQYAYAETSTEEIQLAEWRKHNRLQGWMEELWNDKGRPNAQTEGDAMGDFNRIPLELTLEDIENLEFAIDNFDLPETSGFFFGNDSYFWTDEEDKPYPENEYYYKENDLEFIEKAKKALTEGHKVYYNCWY